MKILGIVFVSATLSVLSASVQALPAFNPDCAKGIVVKAPPNGAGVYFDRDCKEAYVLPPAFGEMTLDGLARNANLSNCSFLDSETKTFAAEAQAIRNAAERLNAIGDGANGGSGGGLGGGSKLFPQPKPDDTPPKIDDELTKQMQELTARYIEVTKNLAVFWQMEGATAGFLYQVKHQELVNQYQKLNPGLVFKAIPISDARIYLARVVGKGDVATTLPAVMGSSLPGAKIVRQNGEFGEDDGVTSGEAQSGQLVLSLAGACPYYNAAAETFPDKLSAKDLGAYMKANVAYVYELQVSRNYSAKYNLGSFVRRLQESHSSGGLFSSSTVNKLIVEESTKDWFEMTTTSEDGRINYDPGFAQMIKAEIIDRAIKNIAMLVQGQPIEAPGLSKPNPNGAAVGARELRKCPYIYCQVGAAVLDVANAIFGSEESVADYIKTHDTWVTETLTERSMFPFQGTVTFASGPK